MSQKWLELVVLDGVECAHEENNCPDVLWDSAADVRVRAGVSAGGDGLHTADNGDGE